MGDEQKTVRRAKAKTPSATETLIVDSLTLNQPKTLDEKVDFLIQKLSDLSIDNKLLLDKVDKLVNENSKLQNEVNFLKSQINDLKQHQLSDQLFITGVPVNPQENLKNIVGDICDTLQLDSKNLSIESVHRVKSARSSDERDQPIIVKFGNSAAASMILQAQKKSGHIFLHQLSATSAATRSSVNKKINILQLLTRYNLALLMRMKKFAQDNNFKFVWFNNHCKIRKSEGSRVYTIKSFADLDKLNNNSGVADDK